MSPFSPASPAVPDSPRAENGEILSAIVEVQYWHALRISEVLALSYEDVTLDFVNPVNSFLAVRKSVHFPREKGKEPVLQDGYKNSKTGLNEDGVKISRLMPQSYAALKRIWSPKNGGLVFHEDGQIIKYKAVQNAYDAAFKRAGLPYTGTHIMRHGGTRAVYNKTKDLSLAQQHLGNSSLSATQVYAQRSANAWDEHVKSEWEESKAEGHLRGKSETTDG